MSLKKVFASKLKEIRKKRGLTQEHLAELVDVAPRHISFIETARSFPSSDLIERLCFALNITYSDLFDFKEELTREEVLKKLSKILESLDNKKLNYLYKMACEL